MPKIFISTYKNEGIPRSQGQDAHDLDLSDLISEYYLKAITESIRQAEAEQKSNAEKVSLYDLRKIENEAEIFKFIQENAQGTTPILHLILDNTQIRLEKKINFSHQALKDFQYRGGKIVMSVTGFIPRDLEMSKDLDIQIYTSLNYLTIADHIVFFDFKTQRKIVKLVQQHFPEELRFIEKLRLASVSDPDSQAIDVVRSKMGTTETPKKEEVSTKEEAPKQKETPKSDEPKEESPKKNVVTRIPKILKNNQSKRYKRYYDLYQDLSKKSIVAESAKSAKPESSKENLADKKEIGELKLTTEKINLLKKAFRAWRDMPLTQKQACKNEARAYRLMRKVQHVDIHERSIYNFKRLIKRLRNLEGPYSEEMRSFINERRKIKSDILSSAERSRVEQNLEVQKSGDQSLGGQNLEAQKSGDRSPGRQNLEVQRLGKTGYLSFLLPEEKLFIKKLLGSDWKLRHVTPYYHLIQNHGNQLLSVYERYKRENSVKASHTPSMEGNADNVFFTIGPGEVPTVRFLDEIRTVLEIDYKKMMDEHSGDNEVLAQQLQGLWCSDHFYAYGKEQEGEPFNIYGTRYLANYRRISHDSGCVRWVKQYHFVHSDGKHYIQTVEKGDEIFTHPRIDLALLLMVIEKIRLLGKDAWTKIMKERNLKAMESLVHTLFHGGLFEVHQPRQFMLGQPHVKHFTRQPKRDKWESAESYDFLKGLMSGNTEGYGYHIDFQKGVDLVFKDFDIASYRAEGKRYHKERIYIANLTLLGAVILTGQIKALEKLLNDGADINIKQEFILYELSPARQTYKVELDLISCALLVSEPELLSLILNDFRRKELMADPDVKKISETASISLKILMNNGARNQENHNINYLLDLDTASEAFPLFLFLRIDPKLAGYLYSRSSHSFRKISCLNLIAPIIRNQRDLMLQLLKSEIDDINEPLTLAQANTANVALLSKDLVLKPGFTPLLTAIEYQNLEMVRLLLEYKADVNKPYYYIYSDTYPNIKQLPRERRSLSEPYEQYAGFTPLKFAQDHADSKYKNEIVQCLLDHKACIESNRLIDDASLTVSFIKPKKRLLCFKRSAHVDKQVYKLLMRESAGYNCLAAWSYRFLDHQIYIIITMRDRYAERYFILSNKQKWTNTIHLCLENVSIDSFDKEKWLMQFKRRGSIPFNTNEIHWRDLGQIDFPYNPEKTHYIARFIVCDLGLQPELCEMSWQDYDPYITMPNSVLQTNYKNGIKNFIYQNIHITETESEILYFYKNPDINLNKIHSFFSTIISLQYRFMELSKKGDAELDTIKKIVESGVPIHFSFLVMMRRHGLNAESEDMSCMMSALSFAFAFKQYNCVSYLLDLGIKILTEHGIEDKHIKEIVLAGRLDIYKKLYARDLKVLIENMKEHLELLKFKPHRDFLQFKPPKSDFEIFIEKCLKYHKKYQEVLPVNRDKELLLAYENISGKKIMPKLKKKASVCSRCVIL